jgi:hypothetical protein
MANRLPCVRSKAVITVGSRLREALVLRPQIFPTTQDTVWGQKTRIEGAVDKNYMKP